MLKSWVNSFNAATKGNQSPDFPTKPGNQKVLDFPYLMGIELGIQICKYWYKSQKWGPRELTSGQKLDSISIKR